MKQVLDLSLYSDVTIIMSKGSIDTTVDCFYTSGTTEVPFDFTPYTGATLEVFNNSNDTTVVASFKTSEGTMVLNLNSFTLLQTYTNIARERAGTYYFRMNLHSAALPMRNFLRDNFILTN